MLYSVGWKLDQRIIKYIVNFDISSANIESAKGDSTQIK